MHGDHGAAGDGEGFGAGGDDEGLLDAATDGGEGVARVPSPLAEHRAKADGAGLGERGRCAADERLERAGDLGTARRAAETRGDAAQVGTCAGLEQTGDRHGVDGVRGRVGAGESDKIGQGDAGGSLPRVGGGDAAEQLLGFLQRAGLGARSPEAGGPERSLLAWGKEFVIGQAQARRERGEVEGGEAPAGLGAGLAIIVEPEGDARPRLRAHANAREAGGGGQRHRGAGVDADDERVALAADLADS